VAPGRQKDLGRFAVTLSSPPAGPVFLGHKQTQYMAISGKVFRSRLLSTCTLFAVD